MADSKAVQKHFDELAGSYDSLKQRNWYYYASLKKFIAEVIPPGKKVLEIGCATGEILNFLKPAKGVGIDLASKMIEAARAKFPHLEFWSGSFEDFETREIFDYILLADVIEHLEDQKRLFPSLKRLCGKETQVVLTMANPGWEPLLELLEKLGLKMEEGPHFRISERDMLKSAGDAGFILLFQDRYLIFPAHIPLVSALLNDKLGRLPGVKQAALIERFVFKT